uniref:ATP synthase F0 subunit 8 n=1 Tax=Tetragonula pagdeni TaxID=270535 RepID=UPI0021821220|nr:ATP synthase F0 subunit 8 [Tetragonula pagdeni]UVG40750.1 ATP synthase F0 subunit 8 [Tetragonula pagdeni]
MPQMMPINWIMVFFKNITLLFALITLLNSFYMPSFQNLQASSNFKKSHTFKMEWI